MKKLVVICLMILSIIGLGIYESVVSIRTYNDIIDNGKKLEVALNIASDNISKDDTVVELFEKIEKRWNEFKVFALAFANHTQIKDFSQKLSMLKGYIENDDKKESIVSLYILISSAEFLSREFMIIYENIL